MKWYRRYCSFNRARNKAIWALMSDADRTRVFLESERLIDYKFFLENFQSWEGPDPDSCS